MSNVHTRRLTRAIVFVAAALLGLGLAIGFGDRAGATAFSESYTSRIWREVAGGATTEEALLGVGFLGVEANGAPDWVTEICDPDLLEKAVSNDEFTLVNFFYNGSAEEIGSVLNAALRTRNWLECESGCEGVSTYIKEEGECRWLMVECAQIGGETAVVLHIRHI